MGNGFGSSQEPEAQHGWESWCITDTHNLPETAVPVRRHDQTSSNGSSPANRSFGPDEFPGNGGKQPREFVPSPRVKGKPFKRRVEALPDPWWLWNLGTCPSTWAQGTLGLDHHTWRETLLRFLCIYTWRCRGGCFVPVYITNSQDPKSNSLQRTKYLYLACTAIMILQPLTLCSRSCGGQLAYKFNEII